MGRVCGHDSIIMHIHIRTGGVSNGDEAGVHTGMNGRFNQEVET